MVSKLPWKVNPLDSRIVLDADGLVVCDLRSHIGENDSQTIVNAVNASFNMKPPREEREAGELKMWQMTYDISDEKLKTTRVNCSGHLFEIIGYKSSRPKYPFLGRNHNGTIYKLPRRAVEMAFGVPPRGF